MEDVIISSNLAETLLRTLASEELVRYKEWGFKAELEELESTVLRFRAWLRDAEASKVSGYRDRVFYGKLRDMLQEADDLCDGLKLLSSRNNLLVRLLCLPASLVTFLSSIRRRQSFSSFGIPIINKRLRNIERPSSVVSPACMKAEKQTYSFIAEGEAVGRVAEKELIVDMLLSTPHDTNADDDNISVISIVGLSGLGKTTLAQLVFNDKPVKSSFDVRMWVCLSNVVDTKQVLLKLTLSTSNNNSDVDLAMEVVQKQLIKQIGGKRYLLVLDDLSFDNVDLWYPLRAVLGVGASGSKILVTTRSEHVARVVGTAKLHMLQGLSEDESWALFERLAFDQGQQSAELVNIGQDIVRRCENVPLIIKFVADLLYQKEQGRWLQFRDEKSDLLDMISQDKMEDLLNVLKPSYDVLPSHLKHCFAYCSLFPKDYEYRKHDLIYLWMAQGFLESRIENYSLEDVGEDYFLELLSRCFFQAVKKDALGEIVSCKMHSMVHYLAKFVAGEGSIMASPDFSKFGDRTLHTSIKFEGRFPEALLRASKLRSLLWLKEATCGGKLDKPICKRLFSKLMFLRTLDLHDCGIDLLPNNIGNLIHLRCLDLSSNDLVTLPKSITKLNNLQTLKLNACRKLKVLPGGIGKLVMLRCLEIDECESLTYMPTGLGKLSNLHTLNRFVVSMSGINDKTHGGLRVLNSLANLRGTLKIELSGQWTALVQEAPEANLRCKSSLTELKIEWRLGGSEDSRSYYYYGALLEGLQPPPGLKILCIEGYRGKDFPSWARMDKLASFLPNLVILSVEGFRECKHLPSFGKLKLLECLTLSNMERVEFMENGTYECSSSSKPTIFFPSLKELNIHNFYNLKGWWKQVGEEQQHDQLPSFPHLSKLKISNCPKLTSMPLFGSAEEVDFQNVNCYLLEVFDMEAVLSSSSSSLSSSKGQAGAPLQSFKSFASRPASSSLSSPKGRWLQNLPKLKQLSIKACPSMKIFPAVCVGGSSSVQSLVIDNCVSLISVVVLQDLKSLVELKISQCDELDFLDDAHNNGSCPWSSLANLRHLIIRGIPKMTSFPSGVQEIKSLEYLSIAACSGLKELPEHIDGISSLKRLRIEACPQLVSLPARIRHLANLGQLEIVECPKLMEGCKEPNGLDWPNIRHVGRVLLHKSWRYGLMNDDQHTTHDKADK